MLLFKGYGNYVVLTFAKLYQASGAPNSTQGSFDGHSDLSDNFMKENYLYQNIIVKHYVYCFETP